MTEVQRPWGEYGTVIKTGDPLREAGLNWHVDHAPQYVTIHNHRAKTGNYAYIKDLDRKVLSANVGALQFPLQNDTALELFSRYRSKIVAAGTLRDDKLVWFLGETGHKFKLGGNDICTAHVLFTNYHDPNKAPDARFLMIREASFSVLGNEMIVEYETTSGNEPAMIENMVAAKTEEWHKVARAMAAKECSVAEMRAFILKIFPLSGIGKSKWDISIPARRTINIIDDFPGARLGAHTWWHAYNAVCYSIDHLLGHGAQTRLDSSWYGINQKRKEVALKYITRIIKHKKGELNAV